MTLQVKDTSLSPEAVVAKPGIKTTLVLRTENTRGCNRAFVIPSQGVEKILPETGDTAAASSSGRSPDERHHADDLRGARHAGPTP